MADLLFGLETEYAIAGISSSGRLDHSRILHGVMELARNKLVQLPDLNSHSSIFLQNGSRFYVDCGAHPEVCTPEVSNPWDAVRYTLAGHKILSNLLSAVGAEQLPQGEVLCFRSNVDYSGTESTWGCHESYLHHSPQEMLEPQMIPHLVTRVIYTGAGGFHPRSRGLEFTLSPRAAHVEQVVSGSSTSDRGIWHTRSEPLSAEYKRLHVLCGESVCSETSAFLKTGVTALILAMADAGVAPGSAVQLANPLEALQTVAADVTCKKTLPLADGRSLTATQIQRHYLKQAEANAGAKFMPSWTREVCRSWRAILDQLENAPGSVAQTLDWGIKLALYANYARRIGLRWDDLPFWKHVVDRLTAALSEGDTEHTELPLDFVLGSESPIPREVAKLAPLLKWRGLSWDHLKALLACRKRFFEIDWRFGQIGQNGIFQGLDHSGVLNHRVSGVENIERAMAEPPASGRAHVRGQVIGRLAGGESLRADWQYVVNFKDDRLLDLSDPFTNEEKWRPLNPSEKGAMQMTAALFQAGIDGDIFQGSDQLSRRHEALDRYLSGDYSGAEELLSALVEEGFETPSNRCHLARVLMMMDREEEARLQVNEAWTVRAEGHAYVTPRILFFQCVFAMFDGAPIAPIIGQIKTALRGSVAHSDWTIQPMLDHLRARLGETNYRFLKALAAALSDPRGMHPLNEFSQWRDAATG